MGGRCFVPGEWVGGRSGFVVGALLWAVGGYRWSFVSGNRLAGDVSYRMWSVGVFCTGRVDGLGSRGLEEWASGCFFVPVERMSGRSFAVVEEWE